MYKQAYFGSRGNSTPGALVPIINYETPDGRIGSIFPDITDTIGGSKPLISAAIADAKALGANVSERWVSVRTGITIVSYRHQ